MKLSKSLNYKPIIGLEVHIELKTKSKMFCGCKADYFGKPPNTLTCPVCLGLPGALPVPNKEAVEKTIILGLALNCKIKKFSQFDRKNYFYPDLPKGYQISQYNLPLAFDGRVTIEEIGKPIRIRRVHLEEDTGKMIHQKTKENEWSLIDFNRSGVPLVEIVSEPDFEGSNQVVEFLKYLQRVVRYLGIADANMERGQMRCEPTVNLKITDGKNTFYTPLVELKNINSFRFVKKAIDYEIEREWKEFLNTGRIKQDGQKTTRGWEEKKGITVLQREKEEAADYRYFPEPDIPPLIISEKQLAAFRLKVSELPEVKKQRFIFNYNLPENIARVLTSKKELADYFEEAVRTSPRELDPRQIANVIVNRRIDILKLSPKEMVKTLLKKQKVVKIKGEALRQIVSAVLQKNPKALEDYQKGKANAIQFLIGQIMKETKGQADPEEIKTLILKEINKFKAGK